MENLRPVVLIGALGAAGILSCSIPQTAHADLSWEHSLTVRSSKQKKPIFKAKIYNNWSRGSRRILFKLPADVLADRPMSMPLGMTAFQPAAHTSTIATGTAKQKTETTVSCALIVRLDDDRIVSYESPTRQYIKEPLRPLLKRLRFNPWPKLDAKLDKEPVPSLTEEQRRRLGAEVRAVARPALKNVWRTYFRALPGTRTINGIEGHGYRLTWMVNDSPMDKKSGAWGRINMEWWLASELSGDEQVRNFRRQALDLKKEIGGMSASMWLNELYPVLWQMLPEEIHEAAATVIPPDSSPRAGFGGTPLQMFMTIQPPPLQRSIEGDVRVEIALHQRHTNTLPASVFDAPAGYKRMPLEPELKKYDNLLKGQLARAQGQSDRMGFNLDSLRQTSIQMALVPTMALTAP